MEQIVKRKKKGRPPKVDPGTRVHPPPERDLRRSLRRRNVKYVFDLDDYFDEDQLFTEDEDQCRREKKLEQLLKLQTGEDSEAIARQRSRFQRVNHVSATSASSSEDDDNPSKKRRINGCLDRDTDDDNDYLTEEDCYNGREKVRERKRDPKAKESPPETPVRGLSQLPFPDKKTFELILDKLQKKDIYGVYAEPVDPEELPDYHDIIEHPMDFATVRNKLRNGSYLTFKQFESDVFLICSNAMQYNAPDTVYYKHARTIEELAKRKFEKIKLNMEFTDKEIKLEQKSRSGSTLKTQKKRPADQPPVQEPVGSDFSYGATLATASDSHTVSTALRQPAVADGLADGNSFYYDSNLDKSEESLLGKGHLSRIGRKSFLHVENCRATYAISLSEAVVSTESIFSTFDAETKQLVPVGLYVDHSYARSLAHFAATLGSVAWRVASKRIEEALPQGLKFGQGWVADYEPLPTPILLLNNCPMKELPFFAKRETTNLVTEIPDSSLPLPEHRLPFFNPLVITTRAPVITVPAEGNNFQEMNPAFFSSPRARPIDSHDLSYQHQSFQSRSFCETNKRVFPNNGGPSLTQNNSGGDIGSPNGCHNLSYQHQSFQSRAFSETDRKVFPKHVESNDGPRAAQGDHSGSKNIPRISETEAFGSPCNKSFLPPGPFKHPNTRGPTFLGIADRKIATNHVESSGGPSAQKNSGGDIMSLNGCHNLNYQHQSFESRAFSETDRKVFPKHVESNNGPPSGSGQQNSGDHGGSKNNRSISETEAFGSPSNKSFLPPAPFKYPNTSGPTFQGVPDGKIATNRRSNGDMRVSSPSSYLGKPVGHYPHHETSPSLSDPVQLMTQLSEKACHNQSSPKSNAPQILCPSPNFAGNDPNNASLAAARAWICVGSGGLRLPSENENKRHTGLLYNSTHELQSQYHTPRLQHAHAQEKNVSNIPPVYGFMGQGQMPLMVGGNEMVQYQNHPVVFPQLAGSDLLRLQMQSPAWRGISPQMHMKKHENFPPDLNIRFQSSGSPGRPSSEVLPDSQQPDLALQL